MSRGNSLTGGGGAVRGGTVTDARLFELLENVPAGILVVDAEGAVVYANAAWQQIFGAEVTAQIRSAPVSSFDIRVAGTGERYPAERRPITRALRGEHARAADLEVRLPQGSLILDVEAAPIRAADGSVAFAIASVVDITARVRAEEAYRNLFENAPIGIYRASPSGVLLLANPALLEMLGCSSLDELKEWNLNRERILESTERSTFERMLEEKGEIRGMESAWSRLDGTHARVTENVRVVRDVKGRVTFYEGTIEDTTEQKNIEQELRRSREEYRYLIEKATDIIYRCDVQGRFRYVNPTVGKVLGYEEQELIGKHFSELIDPDFRAAANQFYQEQFRTKLPNTYYEFPVIARNGDRVWIGQNVQPVMTGEWILGFQAVARDISQRKEMEMALARARDAALESARGKSEFLANMSHEIRTPLNGVIGMSDLLLRMNLSTEQRDAAQTIRSSAESLLMLVDDILDLSKIEAGKLTVQSSDFDLDEVIDNVTDLFAERAAAKGLKLRAVIYPGVHRHLVGDALRVRQVLINLVGNAVKFTETGEVSLSVMEEREAPHPDLGPRSGGEGVVLWFLVNDTGIGINEADQVRLFSPFMQADATTTRRFGGTGLGLAISKQLVDMMGGRIGVASVPGEGSTFWFTTSFAKDLRPEAQMKKSALAGARALLVDSSEVNRLMLRRHLTSSSLSAEEAAPDDVVPALKRAAAGGKPIDVVVVEMQLEGTDGISVTRAIHADPETRDIPVVLITSIGRRKSDVEFFQAEHIDTWVMKPVRRAQLVAAIAQVIRRDVSAGGEPAPSPAVVAAEGGGAPLARKPRILIVEDNVINQKVAAGQLRLLGYESDIASGGSAAIELVRRQPYDLILLDCQMPEMDGYDVAASLRRMENKIRRVPIVAMTAYTGEGEREKCIAAGMDDFMTKPVSTQRLGAILARWLGHRETEVVDSGKVAGLQLLARSNPTFMQDLTGLFREDSLVRLHELRDAVAAGNAEALSRAAHALKSSSGNIGASRMYAISANLEANAKQGEMNGAGEMVEQLATELGRALEALTESSGSTGA